MTILVEYIGTHKQGLRTKVIHKNLNMISNLPREPVVENKLSRNKYFYSLFLLFSQYENELL